MRVISSLRLPLHSGDAQTSGSPRPRALFAKGFRPFFLLASAFAFCMLPLWIAVFFGVVDVDGYLGAVVWHAHEMIFGFAVAVIAGFLLTAVGNWTQRETVVGVPLARLCALWIAGRVAVTFASRFPRGVPAIVDLAFLPALMIAVARPLVLAKKYRHLVMLAVLAGLFASNVAVHLDALGLIAGAARPACLVGVDIITLLVLIMAGRVFPMFTRNATGIASIRSSRSIDLLTLGGMATLIVLDVVAPEHELTAMASVVVGALALLRSRTWGARHSLREPLLWILHAGYLWIPLGLILRGVAAFDVNVLPSLATHALTAGAIGSLSRTGVRRLALGSVSELVVRKAKCPVLVVRKTDYHMRDVPEIEPACPDCLVKQRETAGETLWCERHATRHPQARLHYEVPQSFGLGSGLLRP